MDLSGKNRTVMEPCNPIAAQAASATHLMSPLELNNALVGPGGRPARPQTWRHRFHALLGYVVLRLCVLFVVLTGMALLILCWPTAPWCVAAGEIKHRVIDAQTAQR